MECSGDHALRPPAETQCELQRVPGVIGPAPLAELVAPRGIELRSAQAVGIVGGKHLRHGSVRPHELVLRDFELGASVGRKDREQARYAFDHDAAHLGDSVADEGDAVRAAVCERRFAGHLRADPFGAGTGLTRAATAEHEPRVPASAALSQDRRELVVAAVDAPVVFDDAVEVLPREVAGEKIEAFRTAGTAFQDAPPVLRGGRPSRMRWRDRRCRCRR